MKFLELLNPIIDYVKCKRNSTIDPFKIRLIKGLEEIKKEVKKL